MEIVSATPFLSVGHCLHFWNSNNPARMKPLNLLEPEGSSRPKCEDFSGSSSADLFASITLGIKKTLDRHTSDQRQAFWLRNFGDRERHLSIEAIAAQLHTNARTVYRWLDAIHQDLEQEFVARELIDPIEELKTA